VIPKVAGWKKDRVSELTEIFSSDGVVAVVDVSGVPASNNAIAAENLR
jgi:ribosomal protein L10